MPPAVPVPVKLDDAGHIDQDTTCIRCGYNLRGLSANSVCPECGTAVGRSFQGDLLRFAPPEWVEKLARGVRWALAGAIIAILGTGVSSVCAYAVGHHEFIQLVMQVSGIIGVIGYWMATTRDPGRLEREPLITARKLIRATIVTSYLWGFVMAGIKIASSPASITAINVGMLGWGVVAAVEYCSIFAYARQLALRLPNRRLAIQARILMWGVVAMASASATYTTIAVTITFRNVGTGPQLMTLICLAFAVGAALAIWSLVLLVWFYRELSQAALLARQTWARPVQQVAPASFPGARW